MEYLNKLEQLVGAANRISRSDVNRFAVKKRPERVPEVSELRAEIKQLGVRELSYFEEGLDCIQFAQASRASIVLGWTGYIDLLQKKIGEDGFTKLNAILKSDFGGVYKKAGKINSTEELAKYFDDSLLLQAAKKLGILKKHSHTQLDAMRDERNNCAHVQEYAVTPRMALGFYAKLIQFLPLVL